MENPGKKTYCFIEVWSKAIQMKKVSG